MGHQLEVIGRKTSELGAQPVNREEGSESTAGTKATAPKLEESEIAALSSKS
jgi:hypothetical protein